ncbi:Polynucleotide 5 -hydroxyl-kinase NOL9, partial [Paramuricea clavata]
IVRNIDTVKQLLYIITPEPLEVLKTVKVLVKGRLEILDCLYKKQTYGNIPFVTSEFTYNHRGSGQKRVRYNLLRQRSPNSPKPKEEIVESSTSGK